MRTRVHEYGGGAYAVDGDTVYFSHFADNRALSPGRRRRHDAEPVALTHAGRQRHADFVVDRQRRRLVSVRELHNATGRGGHAQPVNTLCAIAADGSETVLAPGADFYAAPRMSPDGRALAWLSWDHPRMPWQGTELWLAEFNADGTLAAPRRIAGGRRGSDLPARVVAGRPAALRLRPQRLVESVPLLRSATASAASKACARWRPNSARPHWTFGGSMYGFRSANEIICTYIDNGVSRLARLLVGSGKLEAIANPYQEIRELRVGPGFVVLLGGGPTIALELARIDFTGTDVEVLAQSIAELPDTRDLSIPDSISYASADGRTAHAFFYPPASKDVRAPEGSKPPVIVISHGGPTGMTVNTLKLATQFWTSRGFGVLDVNYGGSSGFGRAYRDALKGQWGIVDVEDCIAGARALVERGLADGERLIIRGGSAGGLTTLCALTFHDVFKLGASYYGVSDLKGLDQDSHKFESHYNAYLIAPQPQARGAVPGALADQPHRPPVAPDDFLPGPGRQGGAAAAVADDGRRADGARRAGGLSAAGGRGPRLPQGREHRAHAGSGAVFLPARLRPARGRCRRDAADPDPQPELTPHDRPAPACRIRRA